MKDKVIFQRDQQLTEADLNNLSNFPQETFDLLIREAIEPGLKYSGFPVIESAPAQVSVGAGIVLGDGKLYYNEAEGGITVDMISNLPALANKYVAIVAWGVEQDTQVEPRTFMIDPVTRATEARAVATVRTRYANIDKVVGTESTTPLVPLVPTGAVIIAIVLLSPAGIESVTQNLENQLVSSRENADALIELGIWRQQTGASIETIRTDMTALAEQARGAARVDQFVELARDVAHLKSIEGLPEDYSSYGYDPFLVLEQSDTDALVVTGQPNHPNLDVLVEEGLRFPPIASHSAQLNLLNSDDPRVRLQDGFIMPVFSEVLRLANSGRDDEVSLAQYENQTVEMVQKTVTRQRIRYGGTRTVCTNNAWWKSGKYDPVTGIFRRGGETFILLEGDYTKHTMLRVRQFWTDYYTEAYWGAQTTTNSVNGSVIAQTFLNSQDTWLTSIGLFFTRKGNANVTVAVVETTEGGAPDIKKVVAQTTLTPENIALYPQETRVPMPLTLLERGKRYAIVPISTGAHYLACTIGNKFNHGSLFYSTDGSWFQGDLIKDLALRVYAAKFDTPRVEVQLESWELAGGILDIDLLADAVVPAGTTLSYDVRINNVWVPLSESALAQLSSLPPLLQARAVFQGTTDLMPRLGVGSRSRVLVARPKQAFTHVSDAKTPPAPVNTVWVDVRLEAFDAAHNTALVRLLSGAGYATTTTAATVETVFDPDAPEGTITRRYIFTFGAPITSFKIRIDGTTDSVHRTFHVAFRQFVALTA